MLCNIISSFLFNLFVSSSRDIWSIFILFFKLYIYCSIVFKRFNTLLLVVILYFISSIKFSKLFASFSKSLLASFLFKRCFFAKIPKQKNVNNNETIESKVNILFNLKVEMPTTLEVDILSTMLFIILVLLSLFFIFIVVCFF